MQIRESVDLEKHGTSLEKKETTDKANRPRRIPTPLDQSSFFLDEWILIKAIRCDGVA